MLVLIGYPSTINYLSQKKNKRKPNSWNIFQQIAKFNNLKNIFKSCVLL